MHESANVELGMEQVMLSWQLSIKTKTFLCPGCGLKRLVCFLYVKVKDIPQLQVWLSDPSLVW